MKAAAFTGFAVVFGLILAGLYSHSIWLPVAAVVILPIAFFCAMETREGHDS